MKQLVNYGYINPRKFFVNVTKTDIKNGKKCDNKECPVGLAIARELRRQFPQDYLSSQYTIWGNAITFWSDYRGYFDTAIPPNALKFIQDFDADLPVEPFKFKIDVTEYFYCEHT